MPYTYMERKMAKVSGDFHVRFDNVYYSVDWIYRTGGFTALVYPRILEDLHING